MDDIRSVTGESAVTETSVEPRHKRLKGKAKISTKALVAVLFLIVMLGIAASGAYLYIDYADQWVSTNNASVEGRIYNVSVNVPGKIERINVKEGMFVERGAFLASLDSALKERRIISPAPGYVAHMQIEAGEYVLPGQTIMSVVNLEDLWITANFTEKQIRHVRVGQEVDIYIDAYPDEAFTGKVESIMPAGGAAFALFPADATAGNWVRVAQRIPVKIVFDDTRENDDLLLRIGMLARVRVER